MALVQCSMPQQDEHGHGSSSANESCNLKRKSTTKINNGEVAGLVKCSKGIVLSLTKPSYVLGLGSKTLRFENRARLSDLLRKLMRQHNWTEASGVLSVLLQGTCKEKSLVNNRFKYSALMEVIAHVGADYFNATRIKNIYDVWIRKNGSLKGQLFEDRFVVHLEFILFCLTEGNVEDAHQIALWLMQENEFGRDPISNMIVGLTFYQLWYTTLPKDMLLTNFDQVHTPSRTNEQVAYSERWDGANSNEAGTGFQCDSDSSVKNDKMLSINCTSDLQRASFVGIDSIQRENLPQNFQPQGFYANSAENTGNEVFISNHGDQLQYASTYSALEGLNSLLLPVRFPRSIENSEDLIYLHTEMLNDYYKEAVKYLRLALGPTSPILAALLPLIQLLLVGGQVDEALKELDKFCCNPNSTLPIRLRASLLENLCCNNIVMLSTCFEDILKKDPTCGHSLANLVTMHQNGEYSSESLLEMIACHLDATYADYNTWRELASCFLKLSEHEEDRMSACLNGNEDGRKQRHSVSFKRIPKIFKEGKSAKNWRLRCRWWLTRHFSSNTLASEIAAGDLELLTYKAACATHVYGPSSAYVVDVHTFLEKKNEKELFSFLKLNSVKSIQLCSSFKRNNR